MAARLQGLTEVKGDEKREGRPPCACHFQEFHSNGRERHRIITPWSSQPHEGLCFLLLKVMNKHWKEGKGASGRKVNEDAEKGGKVFQRNIWEGMVLRARVEGLMSNWIWRCFCTLLVNDPLTNQRLNFQ